MSSTQQLLLGEGAGGGAAPVYIEDVFSTWLYTGNSTTGGTQTITNGLDLSTKGGLVWIKGRSADANNMLYDTVRGAGTGSGSASNKALSSNLANAQGLNSTSDYLSAFGTTGFTVTQGGSTTATQSTNYNGVTYAAWAFEKQAKFFTCKTYSGSASLQNITHDLGSVPGCIMIKKTTGSASWIVYHRSLGSNKYVVLQSTGAEQTDTAIWNNTAPTSSVFTVGGNIAAVNESGDTYVAYLFAHDAGGFGLTGADNVISCGSYTGNGSATGPVVTLGYEPQWLMIKNSSAAASWFLIDVMRGFSETGFSALLAENSASEIVYTTVQVTPTATGFKITNNTTAALNASGNTYIYIAIRRGPMKVPTSGTSVFAPVLYSGTDTITNVTTNIVPSLTIVKGRSNISSWYWTDMLRGSTKNLRSNTTGGQQFDGTVTPGNTGFTLGVSNGFTNAGVNFISYSMLRAPQFFDEVCYTGTGSGTTFAHNLTVVPELMIVKRTSGTEDWAVYSSALGNNKALTLNADTSVLTTTTYWSSSTPTSSVFTVGSAAQTNASGATYVNYLFATLAGVSKVGSYVGNGVDTTIDCGFVDGARLVLIKSTSFADNWAIFDSARGYATASDPYLALNAADAESTGNWLLFRSEGFGVRSSSFVGGSLNVSGQSYIFLAIA